MKNNYERNHIFMLFLVCLTPQWRLRAKDVPFMLGLRWDHEFYIWANWTKTSPYG